MLFGYFKMAYISQNIDGVVDFLDWICYTGQSVDEPERAFNIGLPHAMFP